MHLIARISSLLFVALVILAVAGCYDRNIDGHKMTMVCSSWVPRVTLGLSLGIIVVGLVLRKRSLANLLICGALGLFGLLVILPATTLDNIIIDDDHYERNGGFSHFFRLRDEIKFKEVDRIELISLMERARRGRVDKNYYLMVYDKDSTEPRKLPVGDMARLVVGDIALKARASGVQFINSSDLETP